MYVLNKRVWTYMQQELIEINGKIGRSILNGDFNTSFTIWQIRQAASSKHTDDVNSTTNGLGLTDMYTILHSTVKYMLFSGLHATFLKIYHILSHKTYVDKFKITSNTKYVLKPQYETRNKLQRDSLKTQYLEI